ncbi:MAG: response regulator [Chitinophagaceae bacterium]|nr:response regulator [Chitinophagaceae bacterium]
MQGSQKYAQWLFLAGLILIVFIQFISSQNINKLIDGNQRLLKEIKLQNNLRQLELKLLTIESDIRGIVILNDRAIVPVIEEKIQQIQNELSSLKFILSSRGNAKEIKGLDFYVHKKLAFSRQVLDAYKHSGKDAAAAVVKTGYGMQMRDSIIAVTTRVDSVRHTELSGITSSIEKSGRTARSWGLALAAIACLACVLGFLQITKKGRQQEQMIDKLNESEKKLREAAKLKEQFLANMSHEIRTPMNAILGFTSLLKKTDLNLQQSNYVEFIRSSGENLLTIINDILDLSKIEAGMMQIEKAPFSITGLISSVEVIFRERAEQKGLDFKVYVADNIHDTLSGDAVRLTQILINLLSNAIKFTDEGFVHLHVHAVNKTDEEVTLQFSVQDTGIGIAPDKKQAIFERFHQAEAETSRRFGGTGLGLSIVKQIVEMQNGSVEVESEVNKGSTFTVTLAFTAVYNFELQHAVQVHETHLTLKDVRILIAEDNLMNQQLINHLMKQWHIDHVLVSNGQEVLAALKNETFSLVLMDVQMPEMDGYAATLAIRNDLKLDVPIIAMTAHALAGEKEICLSYGMNDYISKPLKESELYRLIKQYARGVNNNSSGAVIDLSYLKELSNGDVEFENSIIREFIIQMPKELELLREAVNNKEFQQIKSIAHGMKSSVSYMGLSEKIFSHLQRMETEAANNSASNHFNEDYHYVEAVCNQAVEEARHLIGSLV